MRRAWSQGPVAAVFAMTACLPAVNQSRPPQRFDGERAFAHVRELVSMGPRPAGSPGSRKAREYITAQLRSAGWTVEEQRFEAQTPLGRIPMVNVRARLSAPGPYGQRLIVGGHYDTKLFREFDFVGANDGGSSTAFLLEFARVAGSPGSATAGERFGMPIELLFLDGEEAVVEWTGGDHTYGSRHYVQAARASGDLKNIRAFILVDMIGDRDLRILRESRSTPWLTDIIWSAARRLQRPEFVDRATPVDDDHIEFLKAGVPAVDIIDLDYPAWHTADDTLDKVAASSLQAVGDVLLAALPDIARHVSRQSPVASRLVASRSPARESPPP